MREGGGLNTLFLSLVINIYINDLKYEIGRTIG